MAWAEPWSCWIGTHGRLIAPLNKVRLLGHEDAFIYSKICTVNKLFKFILFFPWNRELDSDYELHEPLPSITLETSLDLFRGLGGWDQCPIGSLAPWVLPLLGTVQGADQGEADVELLGWEETLVNWCSWVMQLSDDGRFMDGELMVSWSWIEGWWMVNWGLVDG